MSKLIIVCGLPGTGKTTLANALSRELKMFCLHKDTVKESLYESLGMSTLEDSKKIGLPSVKVALALAEENIKNGVDLILESPFNFPDEGALFKEWQEKYTLDLTVVVLEIDQAERQRRFTERQDTNQRHKSHHDTDRLRQYQEERCSYDHMPERKLFLTTDAPVEALVTRVLEQLK